MKTMTMYILVSLAAWSFWCELPAGAAEPRSLDEKLLDDSQISSQRSVDGELLQVDGEPSQPPRAPSSGAWPCRAHSKPGISPTWPPGPPEVVKDSSRSAAGIVNGPTTRSSIPDQSSSSS